MWHGGRFASQPNQEAVSTHGPTLLVKSSRRNEVLDASLQRLAHEGVKNTLDRVILLGIIVYNNTIAKGDHLYDRNFLQDQPVGKEIL